MRILHTGDWHVGKPIRGRSRADEHGAVLAEIGAVAAAEQVDVVLVAGDLFDTAAPSPESEQIVYGALLELPAPAPTSWWWRGNHDNERRLQAVAAAAGARRVTRRRRRSGGPTTAGCSRSPSRDGAERARVALLPFLSQRWVVQADELMVTAADQQAQAYGERMRHLVGGAHRRLGPGRVNVVVAHLFALGRLLGGGEREAHTIFDYGVSATAFPATPQYVALGHLHRSQMIPGPCPIRYAGSPLQLDFGETRRPQERAGGRGAPRPPGRGARSDRCTARPPSADAGRHPGRGAGPGGDHRRRLLRVRLRETPRVGLAEEVRECFPDCVDVQVLRPEPARRRGRAGRRATGPDRRQRDEPAALFRQYLGQAGRGRRAWPALHRAGRGAGP